MTIKVDENVTIVFDLDDTLYNELDYLKSAYRTIAKKVDEGTWRSTYALMLANYREGKDVFEVLSLKHGIDKASLISDYRNHQPEIKLFEHVNKVLVDIKDQGGKLAVLTDGRSATQRRKIHALGLESILDGIYISEEIGSEKPSERNFRMIEADFGTEIYYYIADNYKKDFITPKKLGWRTIALVDNGKNIHFNSSYFELPKHLPDAFILDFHELQIQ